MKLKLALCMASILLISGIFAWSISSIKSMTADKTGREALAAPVSESVYKYTLKTNNGKLGVFSYNTDTLIAEYDVCISSLPEADIELLGKGLDIRSDDDLRAAIEDYTS